mgnify:CR=1 FL=1
MMTALPAVPLSVGASRIIRGERVEHVCGDPGLSEAQDHALGMRIVQTAIRALQTPVSGPTVFEPSEYRTKEAAVVS